MSDINARLDRLYDRSFGRYVPGLKYYVGIRKVVPCGLFSPTRYQSCRSRRKRVVIILKEPWSTNNARWSWRTEGRRIARLYHFNKPQKSWGLMNQIGRLGYLVAAVDTPRRYERLPAFDDVSRPQKSDGILCMGLINIKKECHGAGYRAIGDATVRLWAEKTKHVWTMELETMDPDIVLCGGKAVYDAVADGLDADPPRSLSE